LNASVPAVYPTIEKTGEISVVFVRELNASAAACIIADPSPVTPAHAGDEATCQKLAVLPDVLETVHAPKPELKFWDNTLVLPEMIADNMVLLPEQNDAGVADTVAVGDVFTVTVVLLKQPPPIM
jgi:hypothetical protein